MGLFGGGGPGTATGFNEGSVNDCISTYNSEAKNVMNTLQTEFNKVLKALSSNWGTQEGMTFVTDTFVPNLKKTAEETAETLLQIGKVIKTTGERQAADTKNSVSISEPQKAEMGELKNEMKEKLDNGYVGVYDNLKSDVASAHATMVTNLDSALGRLQSNVVEKTNTAFVESGQADQVSAQITTFIQEIQASIDSHFATLQTDIDTFTADADTYAHNIQQAGLRGSATS